MGLGEERNIIAAYFEGEEYGSAVKFHKFLDQKMLKHYLDFFQLPFNIRNNT